MQIINSPTINDFQVTKATVKDAVEICSVVNEAFTTDIFRIWPRTSLSEVSKSFDDEHIWFVVKIKENEISKIAGVVLYSKEDDKTSSLTNIQMLAVRPQFRGKNVGQRLIKKIESTAIESGKEKIGLLVAEINSALCKFYINQGYLKTGSKLTLLNSNVKKEFRSNTSENYGHSKIHLLYMEKRLAA